MSLVWKMRSFRGDALGEKRPNGGFHYGMRITTTSFLFRAEEIDEWLQLMQNAYNWCAEHIGPQHGDWDTSFSLQRAHEPKVVFNFRNENHRLLFKLAFQG